MTDERTIRFQITPKSLGAHLFEVMCWLEDPSPGGQVFSMPAWIPGSYMIREFAKNVVRLWAFNGDQPVSVKKVDKSTWRCEPCAGPLIVRYEIYAWDLSVRTAHLDTTHAYFNGSSVFIRIHGKEHAPHLVDIRPPEGEVYQAWRVATALSPQDAPPFGFGRYRAADYDELIDHPVEMGTFTVATFYACGHPHHIAITGKHRTDMDRLCRDLTLLCEQQMRFFGEPPPMQAYVFLVTAVGNGYGGLEHRASCSLLCSRDDLPRIGQQEVSEKYRTFLGLCSHEYFHLWNVKRIKPAAFVPYDLSKENYTALLWAFEGITSYYQHLMLLRCGLIMPEIFLELLAHTVSRVWRSGGRFKQSLTESSFDSWIKFYKPDENAPNAIVSYYAKGALTALALDLMIRRDTRNAHSLDDVMRALWQRYGQRGEGVAEEGIEKLIEEISGLDLKSFFKRVVHGVEDPPLAELLPQFGVAFALRPAVSAADQGGYRAKETPDKAPQGGAMGVRLAEHDAEAKLITVYEGSAAQLAGLAAGDIIVAIDGLRTMRANFESQLSARTPGETVTVYVFRRDELMCFTVTLQAPAADTCVLSLRDDIDGAVRERRVAWLGAA
jgi:predicted metalloprotease with PDZ domain